MLYVSRRVGHKMFGICDTDDGKEQIVGILELSSICQFVDIAGVTTHRGRVYKVDLYQLDMYVSTLMMKTKVMLNVDVGVWRDYITDIQWNNDKITRPVSLKLSDFAKKCAAGILTRVKDSTTHKVTLVLDDFIEFDDMSFNPGWFQHRMDLAGVKFDIRQLRDNDKAFRLYENLAICMVDKFKVTNVVIDSEARLKSALQRMGCVMF